MKAGYLFAGIGAPDLGFGRVGIEPAWQVEIDKKASSVLARHWPEVHRHDDICTFTRSSADPVDLICGGSPCQDLSVAGRRAGLAGERSGLFYEFARVVAEFTPRWVVFENVPGLLSSNAGRDMGIVLGTLGELGYGWAYRVLDAQFFGVAQRRRRVFIVGCLGDGRRAAEVLLEPESLSGDPAPSREQGATVANALRASLGSGGADDNRAQGNHLVAGFSAGQGSKAGSIGYGDEIAPTIRAGASGLNTAPSVVIGFHPTQDSISEPELAPSLGANSTGMGVLAFDTTQVTSKENRSNPKVGDPCHPLAAEGHPPAVAFTASAQANSYAWESDVYPTLNAQVPNDTSNLQYGVRIDQIVRRLTPKECERLQGFPDDWTAVGHDGKPIADGPRYRMLGNSWAVPVGEWIARRIVKVDS